MNFIRDRQFYKFSTYGFLKNLRFFEPFIILYFREVGFSFLDIGILFAIREISTVLLEVPTGFIADIRGRKISMVSSMAAYIVSFLTFFLFPGFTAAAFAMVLFACGEAFRTGTHKAMILEYLSITGQCEWKADYYGATRAASKLGSAVNALIAGALVFLSGSFRYIFLAAIFPCILNMINLSSYPARLNGIGSGGETHRPGFRDTLSDFFSIFRNRDASTGLANSAGFDGFFKVMKEYLQPVLQSIALGLPILAAFSSDKRTALVAGAVYFVLFMAASTASRYSGVFSRRVRGITRGANHTWLLGSCMLIIAGLFQKLEVLAITVIAYLVLFILQNLRRPLCVTYISGKVPGRVMASGLSAESLLKMLVMAVLAPLCGYVADQYGIGVAVASAGLLMSILYLPLRLREEISA